MNGLNSHTFVLGINDNETEDNWVFDSDRTPVVYQNWKSGDESQGRRENCAFMFRNHITAGAAWGDYPCLSDAYMEALEKSLICQKNAGMHLAIV